MTEKLVKLDATHQEALHRMTEVVLERRGRPDLVDAMDKDGATVTLGEDGVYVITVAGEEAARVSPWRLAEFVAHVEAGRASWN